MPQQDFLVWAPSGGNVMSQANYAANTNLANGVVTGIADPTLANKTWRQASIMATVIAAFIQQEIPAQTVVDDGTTTTILASLTAALKVIASAGAPFVLLQDQKTPGTNGGTATSGSFQTRDLTTKVIDTGNICTLAANQFTLPAGTYRLEAWALACSVNGHQAIITNITDSLTVATGTTAQATTAGAGDTVATTSMIDAYFTIASSKTFALQHRVEQTVANTGFGVAEGWTTEVYSTVKIWKLV